MFTRKEQLEKKGGPEERLSYLRQLHHEFTATKSPESKKQVLANLANFAYDPINYDFLKRIRVIDLFLEQLSENSEELVLFATGGLCNLCIDPENREYIIRHNGISLLSGLLDNDNVEIQLNVLTTIIYLITPENTHLLTTADIVAKVYLLGRTENTRLKNLAAIYLQDHCSNARQFYKIGDKASIVKTITLEDIDNFSNLSGDFNPIHSESERERAVVHGAFLNALVSRVIGTKLPGPGTMVISQNLNFPNKCYAGEELTVNVELTDVRKVITARFVCEVVDCNKIVLYGDAKLILTKVNF